ncbi:MAG TPA: ABC transporter ATP-binding protein [Methanothrix sp.]|nr:ABC transporter ATP-binding protein [Methanothrix sp.]
MSFLILENLSKHFDGNLVLNNVSLQLEEKELVALIGPNGSGKTTLFNIVTGFIKPDHGGITFKDVKINNFSPNKIARLGITRTFQRIRLFHNLSVLDNMLLATKFEEGEKLSSAVFRTKLINYEEENNIEKCLDYLSLVGLYEKKDALGEDLSFGQRKLLELARAFASDADLVLLDEPASGVFPETKARLIKIIQKLNEDGKTILFIEHDMELVMQLARRIIVLDHGKMIADGSPDEIINNDLVLDAYFG